MFNDNTKHWKLTSEKWKKGKVIHTLIEAHLCSPIVYLTVKQQIKEQTRQKKQVKRLCGDNSWCETT